MKIKEIIFSATSLIFILLGLFFGLFNSKLCLNVCELCNQDQLGPCYFLFLFVGVIFLVIGANLLNDFRELEKLDNQVKKRR